ncbi:Proteasome maturation factor UMP1 [Zea mays]|uniref:Proteasome maturation factor UMP1 n=1 Tax=Zea mays TaxID=4577 RepID=K7VXB6_MAIZE|nr:Proteasome maturation factor UMP1 [Zea mays]
MQSSSMKREISEAHDTIRFGINAGVKADLAPPHPLQSTIQSETKFWADKKKFGTDAIYGSALNIRKDLDAQILSRFFTIPFAVVLTGEIEFPSINSSIR